MSCRQIRIAPPSGLPWAALITLCVLSFAGPLAAADPSGYPEPIVQWGVQPGETCADISKAMYGSGTHISLILRYNRIACTRGAPLKPGMTLVLPAKVTSVPTARITSVNPETRARAAGAGWATAQPGQPLNSNSNVNTLSKGRAAIQFRDRTRVYMAEHTLVVIYDTASQTAVSKTRPPNVQLDKGELQAGLAALRGEDTVEVEVKGGGRISARSRDAVVNKKGARTTVSVFDGKARVKSAGKTVKVPKHYGTRFVEKKAPEKPRPLPPAPKWEAGGSDVVVFASAEGGRLSASWTEVKRAVSYRFEVSRDANFTELVVRQLVPKDVRAFRAEKMPLGTYYLRVRAIDGDDFLGIASESRQLVVIPAKWTRGKGSFETRAVKAGRYAQVEFGDTSGLEMALDGGAFGQMARSLDFARLQPNKLRVRRRGETHNIELPVEYRDVSAQLAAVIENKTLNIEVNFDGLDGIDPAKELKPSARVVGPKGPTTLPLKRNAAGKWIASMPAEPGDYTISVLGVRGNVLGVKQLGKQAEPDKPQPAPKPKRKGPLPLIGPGLVPLSINHRTNIMWFAPTPHNQATLSAMIANEDGANFQGQTHATGALGPVGIEALIRTRTTEADGLLGDTSAWFGARYRALRIGEGDLELAPNLRIGLPLDDQGPPLRVEAGFGVGGLAGRWTWLTNLTARLRALDNSPERVFADIANAAFLGGGTFRATDWLRLHAMLDAHLLLTPEATYAFGLGAGAEVGGPIFGALSVRGGYEPYRQELDSGEPYEAPYDARRFALAGQLAFGVRAR